LAISPSSDRLIGRVPGPGFPFRAVAPLSPRIVFFDKDRGAEILLRAIGGVYDTLETR
jgi:hypothetical protein